jgi:hypothetical protein
MNFKEFRKSDQATLLNSVQSGFIAMDRGERIIWVSDFFHKVTGFDTRKLKGRRLDHAFRNVSCLIKFQQYHGRIIPEKNRPSGLESTGIFDEWLLREGFSVIFNLVRSYGDFSLFSMIILSMSAERVQRNYHTDLFAILDDDLNFEVLGNTMYEKLKALFGDRRFTGTSLRDYVSEKDFRAWEDSKKKYREYALSFFEERREEWSPVYDSEKQGFTSFFEKGNQYWQVRKNQIIKRENPGFTNECYLISKRTFDFFNNDFKFEMNLSKGTGCIVFNAIKPAEGDSPDQHGYIVGIFQNELRIKRNCNTLEIRPADFDNALMTSPFMKTRSFLTASFYTAWRTRFFQSLKYIPGPPRLIMINPRSSGGWCTCGTIPTTPMKCGLFLGNTPTG